MFRKIFLYPGPLWRLTAVFSWVSLFVALVTVGPIFLVATLLGASLTLQTRIMTIWFRWVALSCFFTFEVRHEGDYDPRGACLVVTNHQSLLDIPAAIFALPGNLRMVAKRNLFWIPIFGQAMTLAGMIPLYRGNKASSRKVLKQIKAAFERGIQVWVAPEGTRSEDGTLSTYRWGAFGLAIQAQIPIQPVVVVDSRLALSKSDILPRVGATIHVVTLPQISTLGLKTSDRESLARRVQELSQEVLNRAASAS